MKTSTQLRQVWAGWLLIGATLSPALAQSPTSAGPTASVADSTRWTGWLQGDVARTVSSPVRTATSRLRTEVAGQGRWQSTTADSLKWKLSARLEGDAAYRGGTDYPIQVRDDQRTDASIREAYVDATRGDWSWRAGSQHIVWGEMVGLFFADVVSAKDLRQFVLQDFEHIRIPQWALRVERQSQGSHWDMIFLPAPAYDRIGRPGADFYPMPLRYEGLGYDVHSPTKRPRNLANAGYGVRYARETAGWDWSTFLYVAPDSSPVFGRSLVGLPGERAAPLDSALAPSVVYRPVYDRLVRMGATAARAFDEVVIKGEAIATRGRRYSVPDLAAASDLVRQDTLDWVLGADWVPADGWRLNGQLYQRVFLDHDRAMGLKRFETGASLMLTYAMTPTIDVEWLGISSLVRDDWMMRAAIVWKAAGHLRVKVGVDAFGGAPLGLFGRFDRQDRAYVQARVSF